MRLTLCQGFGEHVRRHERVQEVGLEQTSDLPVRLSEDVPVFFVVFFRCIVCRERQIGTQ